jgi:hypothetical protein
MVRLILMIETDIRAAVLLGVAIGGLGFRKTAMVPFGVRCKRIALVENIPTSRSVQRSRANFLEKWGHLCRTQPSRKRMVIHDE